jgi:hypothetical protein
MYRPTGRQVIKTGLAVGLLYGIGMFGKPSSPEISKTTEHPDQANSPALIEVTADKGVISGIAIKMEVEKCAVSDEGLRDVQRGVPPALGDLACLGNAQVAQK